MGRTQRWNDVPTKARRRMRRHQPYAKRGGEVVVPWSWGRISGISRHPDEGGGPLESESTGISWSGAGDGAVNEDDAPGGKEASGSL